MKGTPISRDVTSLLGRTHTWFRAVLVLVVGDRWVEEQFHWFFELFRVIVPLPLIIIKFRTYPTIIAHWAISKGQKEGPEISCLIMTRSTTCWIRPEMSCQVYVPHVTTRLRPEPWRWIDRDKDRARFNVM